MGESRGERPDGGEALNLEGMECASHPFRCIVYAAPDSGHVRRKQARGETSNSPLL